MAGQKMRPPFYRLHALTLNPATTMDDLAAALQACEAVQERHRLSEGAVYASAQRRWLLETGADWRTSDAAAAAWGGQSDHRPRLTDTTWACSCGARGDAPDPAAAHTAHREAASSTLAG
jgi:hypothetical protein